MNKKDWKKWFKLNDWKRWTIIVFTIISIGLFSGLSFGLKAKDAKISSDYQNSISLIIKPTTDNGDEIDDSTYSKQLLYNLKNRLESQYPDSFIQTTYEDNNVWKVDITNVQNIDKLKEFISKKNALTVLPSTYEVGNQYFQNDINNNSMFNNISFSSSGNSMTFTFNKTVENEFYKQYNPILSKASNSNVMIWKNIDILEQIYKDDTDQNKPKTLYEYLFYGGVTPEEYDSKGENDSTMPARFKEEFVAADGKTYKAWDFLVAKNPISSFNNADTLAVSKSYGVPVDISSNHVQNEYYDFLYWIDDYSLNNIISRNTTAYNGKNAYTFLIIAMVSFFAIVSIFVVINYGYLGIMAILIMAVVIFLSLLMITVFFGDYDSIALTSVIASAILVFDFIVVFFEKVKREFLKGSSLAKSVKNTISKTKWSMFLKSALVILFIGFYYGVVGVVFSNFSIIVLISSLAIPIVVLPLLILLSNMMVGLKVFEHQPKLIGLWKSKYKERVEKQNSSATKELGLDETIQIDSLDNVNIDTQNIPTVSAWRKSQWEKYSLFARYNKSGWRILWIIISYILIFGLIIFLVSFFVNGQSLRYSFNLSAQSQQQTVLRIAKANNENFTNEEKSGIKKILVDNGLNSKEISVSDSIIEANAKQDFSTDKINSISSEIYGLYDVVIISSNLVSSNTYQVMMFTLYGILAAIIAMCVFVLLWMNWAKALSMLIVFLLFLVSFIFMIGFGLIQINPLLSVAAIFGFMMLLLTSINVISKIHYKLKNMRIEELTTIEIRDVVNKQVFKVLKPVLMINGMTLLMTLLFTVFVGALPFTFTLFMFCSIFVSLLLSLLMLPRLVILFESRRANIKRKVILDGFWDTEKIKEQTFRGINNIK